MSDKTQLFGKTAIVTGSTSGIGLGIAKALARNGVNIVLNGFGENQEIEQIQKEVAGLGAASVMHSSANMLVPGEIAEMIHEAEKTYGSIDILVNNAGIQHVSPVSKFPVDKWNAIIGINLSAAFHTIRNVTPLMERNTYGRIINIASAHSLVASPYKSAYVAAKHGLAGLTKTVALELATSNITVNAIAPGYVETPLVTQQIEATAKARDISAEDVVDTVMLAGQPTKRFVTIDQVSSLAVFLCSNDAASITGAILPIDGGWTAQ